MLKQNKIEIQTAINILKSISFCKEFELNIIENIAKITVEIHAEKGDSIYTAGNETSDGIFIILSGKVNIITKDNDSLEDQIETLIKGDTFGELGIFLEDKRSDTAIVQRPSMLLSLPKQLLLDICYSNIDFNKQLNIESMKQLNKNRLQRILKKMYSSTKFDRRSPEVLTEHLEEYELMEEKERREERRAVDSIIIRKIIETGEWIHLKENTVLFKENDPSDSMFFLIRGLLKVFIKVNDSLKQVGEIQEGEVIGEMGIISNTPRSASIYSTRKSILFKISKNNFDHLMRDYSHVLYELSKQIILRLQKTMNVKKHKQNTTIFLTLIHAGIGMRASKIGREIGHGIMNSLKKVSNTFFLSKEFVNNILSVKDINYELELSKKYYPLDNLITKLEKENDFIILECDPDYSRWTEWCTNLGDRLIYMLKPEYGFENNSLLDSLNKIQKETPLHLQVERQLIIYHDNKNSFPKNTLSYLNELKPISMHFHIEKGNTKDFDRVARILTGKSIGLCLAGGGAKGNAHIGVYKALLENNIPIDIICGTSAGGIVASLIASSYNPTEIITILKESYKRKIFKDYTLPYISLIATKKVEEDAKFLGGDNNIEDLWLPLFTCAVNISTAKLDIIDRGPVWVATRATAALPGILLPVIRDNSLLVDGGLINNMPGDILVKRYGCKLISVSVSQEEDMIPNFEEFPSQGLYFLKKLFMKKKLNKEMKEVDIPNIGSILMRSIMVSSSAKQREVEKLSDIFLNPKVDNIGMLEFDSIDESVEIGYRYTMKELEKYNLNSLI